MKRTILLLTFFTIIFAQDAEITNVQASQRTDGSKLVDISYDLSDVSNDNHDIYLLISFDNGENYTQLFNVSGSIGENIAVGNNKHIVWNAGQESPGLYSEQIKFKVVGAF